MIISSLYISKTAQKGRGVFTSAAIEAGEIIEISPVIVMPADERKLIDQTRMHDYIFEWGEAKDQCCMALGYVAVYNHSFESNCEYFMDYAEEQITIKTMRPVSEGEELTINYGGDWNSSNPVWFKAK